MLASNSSGPGIPATTVLCVSFSSQVALAVPFELWLLDTWLLSLRHHVPRRVEGPEHPWTVSHGMVIGRQGASFGINYKTRSFPQTRCIDIGMDEQVRQKGVGTTLRLTFLIVVRHFVVSAMAAALRGGLLSLSLSTSKCACIFDKNN